MFYELASPSWGEEEIQAIEAVVASGRFTMGERVAKFERKFAKYLGMKYAVMTNSGSSANLLSVASLFFKAENPLKRGDEVIVPALSWSTTYHPLQQYGLHLRIVDIDLQTLNIDVGRLEEALTPNVRAIVAVSILGNPAELDVIRDFADRHDLYLIEDNCESLGAELDGRKTGTFGHMNTFSFFFSHHISTMEGGMVVTDDEELAHLAVSLRAHGWTRDLPKDSKIFSRGEDDHFEAYRFIVPGYNVRPLEMSGAVGLVQLAKLPHMVSVRRDNLQLFQSLFADDPRFIIQREHGKSSSFSFTFIIRPEEKIDRNKVFCSLREEGIGFRIITGGCILKHDALKFYDYECVGDIETADLVHQNGFFVGNHPHSLERELHKLRQVLDQDFR